MADRTLLGMLTPSSNTVLEPVTSALLAGLGPAVTAHFARFRVTEIALDERQLKQFDPAPMLEAARLLADAKPDVIAWNGTSGGWLGLEADRALCRAITAETGIPATTSSLAMVEALRARGFADYGLVTPYLDAVQARILETFGEEGFTCRAERHLGRQDNFAFAEVSAAEIEAMTRAVAAEKPAAIVIYCTNLAGAPLAADLERDLGIPIYDTVSLTVWHCLRLCGLDPTRITGWGSLFS